MDSPLVSICVLSYNSKDTIVETLDSIKEQSYHNIELIISDDHSSDNTINTVTEWVEKNKSRFFNVIVLESNINTGVTANCNRACLRASGVFIKPFGADDILKQEYTEHCVEYFVKNPDIDVLFTKIIAFREDNLDDIVDLKENYDFLRLSHLYQKKWIKKNTLAFLPTASVMYRRNVFDKIGYFDERVPMWEDGPMYYKLAMNNIEMKLLETEDVYYRVRCNSISNRKSFSHMKSEALFYKYYSLRNDIIYSPLKGLFHLWKLIYYGRKDK